MNISPRAAVRAGTVVNTRSMQHAFKLVAVLALACASGASAAPPDTAPKPPAPAPQAPAPAPHPAPPAKADGCKAVGNVVFEIDHRAITGAKAPTATIKLFGNGAWTKVETNADGQALAPSSGCLGKAEAKHIASELRSAPWKITTARVHCMAMSTTFIEFQVDGKLVFTQKLCSGQTLDDKSRGALDSAIAQVEPNAPKSTP
jgi:hypothetical protein